MSVLLCKKGQQKRLGLLATREEDKEECGKGVFGLVIDDDVVVDV